MTMESKLGRVKDALLTVTDNVGHYKAIDSTDKYIVWAENGSGNPIRADNRCIQQVIRGTIDYFTKEENDANVDNIQEALDDAEIFYRLESVQYENETAFIHYVWIWEVE